MLPHSFFYTEPETIAVQLLWKGKSKTVRVDKMTTFEQLLRSNVPKGVNVEELGLYDQEGEDSAEWTPTVNVYNSLKFAMEKRVFMRQKEEW